VNAPKITRGARKVRKPTARSKPNHFFRDPADAKPLPTVRAVSLDDLLSEWRKENPGSIVHVGQRGVTLYPFGADPLKFETTDAALEWLTDPTRPT
jgi:hypothetical protein